MMFISWKFPLLLSALVGLAWISGVQEGRGQVDPEAAKAVKEMSDTLAASQRFAFSGTRTLDAALVSLPGAKSNVYLTKIQVLVSRPDKFFIKAVGTEDTRQFYFDGGEFTLFDAKSNSYGKVLAKSVNIDQLLGHLQTKWGFLPPVSDFIMVDSYKMLMADVLTGKVVGTDIKASGRYKHLAFTQDVVDWELWISDKTHLPKKIVIVFKKQRGSPRFQFDFEAWNLQPVFAPKTFTFVPSPGTVEKELAPLVKSAK